MPKKDTISPKVQSAIDDYRESFAQGAIERALDEMSLDVDEIAKEELLYAQTVKPFVEFVCDTMGLAVGDWQVKLDETTTDGWRVIDLEVNRGFLDHWLSTIYLPPGQVQRFPPALDIPF